MTPHNEAKIGEIAGSVLMPGDPLRAKYIAENFLENTYCYNQVRGALGFTGRYKGQEISIQASGMGVPSFSIYANELFDVYGCKNIIRVGTCGAIHPDVKVGDTIIATGACTDNASNRLLFDGCDYAAVADFDLLRAATVYAEKQGILHHKGLVFSSDCFYSERDQKWDLWGKYGVLGVEMEAVGLYTLAKKYHARGLCLVTVSDHILTKESTSPQERQTGSQKMIKMALETLLSLPS
ncbi:MAG: purine-nucleoside phosphorylase [Spirochaetia bacterium]